MNTSITNFAIFYSSLQPHTKELPSMHTFWITYFPTLQRKSHLGCMYLWCGYPKTISSYKHVYQLFRNKYEIVTVIKYGKWHNKVQCHILLSEELCLTQLKDWGKEKNLIATVNKQFHAGSHAVIKAIDEMPWSIKNRVIRKKRRWHCLCISCSLY